MLKLTENIIFAVMLVLLIISTYLFLSNLCLKLISFCEENCLGKIILPNFKLIMVKLDILAVIVRIINACDVI